MAPFISSLKKSLFLHSSFTKSLLFSQNFHRFYSPKPPPPTPHQEEDDACPTSGLNRPLSEVLKELNKKVPESLVKLRVEDGFSVKYIPWHIVNRIMNLHAPEWSGEVRNITYSANGKSVSVVYRVTLYGTDAEGIYRDSFSGCRRLWGCCTES
ncbi:DNA repair RAD52-like protein 1, mitochondrial isoform X2 [Mangifera indica]|uniref:DNA repair RAD52-like protein 1, mitochondrial isoform X2 n=1 Tax=Mangifera indica TaxID=29780 RepID=UPI001CFB88C9|nr:DNA repair RAD52-like protein 1, mitochondrial isoform X2 [Mangifera indica]